MSVFQTKIEPEEGPDAGAHIYKIKQIMRTSVYVHIYTYIM